MNESVILAVFMRTILPHITNNTVILYNILFPIKIFFKIFIILFYHHHVCPTTLIGCQLFVVPQSDHHFYACQGECRNRREILRSSKPVGWLASLSTLWCLKMKERPHQPPNLKLSIKNIQLTLQKPFNQVLTLVSLSSLKIKTSARCVQKWQIPSLVGCWFGWIVKMNWILTFWYSSILGFLLLTSWPTIRTKLIL